MLIFANLFVVSLISIASIMKLVGILIILLAVYHKATCQPRLSKIDEEAQPDNRFCNIPVEGFTLTFVDRLENTATKVSLDLYESTQSEASRMCQLFVGKESLLGNYDYCLGNTLPSLRVMKTLSIISLHSNYLISAINSGRQLPLQVQMDAITFSYSYAFDYQSHSQINKQLNRGNNQRPDTICMFGEISASAILVAFASHESKEILIIADNLTEIDSIQISEIQHELSCQSYHVLTILNVKEFIIRQQQTLFGRVCDIIHIMGGTHSNLLTLVQTIEPCTGGTIPGHSIKTMNFYSCHLYYQAMFKFRLFEPVRIIWNYYYTLLDEQLPWYRDNILNKKETTLYIDPSTFGKENIGNYSPPIVWDAFFPTATNSGLSPVQTNEGIYSKKLAIYLDFEMNVVDVWMGTIQYTTSDVGNSNNDDGDSNNDIGDSNNDDGDNNDVGAGCLSMDIENCNALYGGGTKRNNKPIENSVVQRNINTIMMDPQTTTTTTTANRRPNASMVVSASKNKSTQRCTCS